MRCELCRRLNPEGAEHCIFCGRELPRPQDEAGSRAPSPEPAKNRIADYAERAVPGLEYLDVTIGPPGPDGACELRIGIRIPLPAAPAPNAEPAADPSAAQVTRKAPLSIPDTSAHSTSTPDADRGPHGLVLSRITTDKKRWTAARVIALLREIPLSDAYQLTARTIIPVLKGVTLEEAEKALELFKALRISGRITTKRAV